MTLLAQFTPAVVAPAADRRAVWWMVGALAERLGLSALPRGVTVDDATDVDLLRPLLERSAGGADVVLGSPSGVVASGPVFGWVHDRVLPEGGWRLAPEPLMAQLGAAVATLGREPVAELVLVPHRQLRTMNSQLRDIGVRSGAVDSVDVRLHPDVAAGLGPDGTPVTVASAHGSLVGRLRADDRLHPLAVAVAHGWQAPNVSALTSAVEEVDPLTGMVRQGGVPVQVHRADGRPVPAS